MTIFLVSCLTFFTGVTAHAYALTQTPKPAESPVAFNFRLGGESTLKPGAAASASLGTTLDYTFFKSYSLGFEYSLYNPYTEFNDYVYNGSNDLSFSLGDAKLWTNRYYGLTLSAKLSMTVPTSHWSQEASIYWISGQSLTLKKTFSDRESISYIASMNEYSVEYIEAYQDADSVIYNTKYDVSNRINYSITFLKGWSFLLGGGVRTYTNYANVTYNIYRFSTGLSAQVTKSATLEFNIKSLVKDADAPATWSGPATSGHLFDPGGTLISFAMSIQI